MASKKDIAAYDFDKGKYINPYTDFGFKKLFGTEANKDFLQHFLQAILHLKGEITQLNFLNNTRLGRFKHERGAVFDIYCETDSGEKFVVEMQKAEQKFFKERSVFYATFPIQEQAKRGTTWDFQLNAVYLVAVLDFEFDDESLKHYWDMQNVIDTAVEKAVIEKDVIIKEQKELIEEQDKYLADKDKLLADKDKEIADLLRQLKLKNIII